MSKILALATSIQLLRNSDVVMLDETLVRQMVNLGIRKIHDVATSHRGNGKYKGHSVWSKSALSILIKNNGSITGITKYLSHAIIAREEDLLLRAFKLSKGMPEDWDGKDVFARYKVTGLYEKLVF